MRFRSHPDPLRLAISVENHSATDPGRKHSMSGFTFEDHSKYCTLRYTAELAEMEWSEVEKATLQVTELVHNASTESVLIDLTPLQQLPVGLLASLLRTWKGLDEKRRQFVVVTPSEHVAQELEQAGLTAFWKTAANLQDGYAALGVSAAPLASAPVTDSPANDPFTFEDLAGYCSVRMNPVLNSMNWSEVEAATTHIVQQIKDSKNNSVMVDLGSMKYINSGLVASLVRIWKTLKEQNGQFSLVSPDDDVTDVLKTAGLCKLWSVVTNREEAVYNLGASREAVAEVRERRLLTLVSVPCAAIALLALGLMYWTRSDRSGLNLQLTALLLSAAAIATGLISLLRDSGVRRVLSLVAVLVSIGVISTLWLKDSPNPIGQPRQPFLIKGQDVSDFDEDDAAIGIEGSAVSTAVGNDVDADDQSDTQQSTVEGNDPSRDKNQ